MKSKIFFRFALMSALLGTSLVSHSPVYAQKDGRRTGGSAKVDRNAQASKNNKEGRSSSKTNKSEGRDSGKARKERR